MFGPNLTILTIVLCVISIRKHVVDIDLLSVNGILTVFSPLLNCSRYVFRVAKYHKKSFQHLTTFFMSTMQEIEFSWWLFELPAKYRSQFSPSSSTFLPCHSLSSKNHRENSISFIFLESSDQVDMKNIVKSSKHIFGYFNTLETQCFVHNQFHEIFHQFW